MINKSDKIIAGILHLFNEISIFFESPAFDDKVWIVSCLYKKLISQKFPKLDRRKIEIKNLTSRKQSS